MRVGFPREMHAAFNFFQTLKLNEKIQFGCFQRLISIMNSSIFSVIKLMKKCSVGQFMQPFKVCEMKDLEPIHSFLWHVQEDQHMV